MNTTKNKRLTAKVESYFKQFNINRGSKIIPALSGGPDSSALLHFLCTRMRHFQLDIEAAWYNHNLRPQAELAQERTGVESLCAGLGVKLHTGEAGIDEIRRFALTHRESPEKAARVFRYEFLCSILEKTGFSYIALGHNQDDQVETVLMRFFQGSSAEGLKGIPLKREQLIRPFMYLPKKWIEEYCSANGVSYCLDSSNSETRFLRNKLRNVLVPQIEAVFPGFRDSVLRTAAFMEDAAGAVKQAAAELPWERTPAGFKTACEDFYKVPPAVRMMSVRTMYHKLSRRYGFNEQVIPYRFFKPLEKPPVNEVLFAGYDIIAAINRKVLFLEYNIVEFLKKKYYIRVNGQTSCFICDKVTLDAGIKPDGTGNEMKIFSPSGCIIRNIAKGDSIIAADRRKVIKKVFNETGIPPHIRPVIPVIENRQGVLALACSLFGFPDIYSDVNRKNEQVGQSPLFLNFNIMEF